MASYRPRYSTSDPDDDRRERVRRDDRSREATGSRQTDGSQPRRRLDDRGYDHRYRASSPTPRRYRYRGDSWRSERDVSSRHLDQRKAAPADSAPGYQPFYRKKIPRWRFLQLRDEGAQPKIDDERGYVACRNAQAFRPGMAEDQNAPQPEQSRTGLAEKASLANEGLERSLSKPRSPPAAKKCLITPEIEQKAHGYLQGS
ncbi:hypothetical protein BST61_g3474 [Cercospora zeina]